MVPKRQRSLSPRFQPVDDADSEDCPKRLIVGPQKVPRFYPYDWIYAKVVRVITPSEFYIRSVNHGIDDLLFSAGNPIKDELKPKTYVLAPINNSKLARSRIVTVNSKKRICKVHFLDFGHEEWRTFDDLYLMNAKLNNHAPRVIKVTLRDAVPCDGLHWTPEECTTFNQVMETFDFLKVIGEWYRDPNDNDDSIPVTIRAQGFIESPDYDFDVTDEAKGSGEDVLNYFNAFLGFPTITSVTPIEEAMKTFELEDFGDEEEEVNLKDVLKFDPFPPTEPDDPPFAYDKDITLYGLVDAIDDECVDDESERPDEEENDMTTLYE